MAAEGLRVVFSTDLDRDDGLVKVPSPGQLLSDVLECCVENLPKGVAEGRFHVRHFDKEVRFHSQIPQSWPSSPLLMVSCSSTRRK
jgi:hypothetical protein